MLAKILSGLVLVAMSASAWADMQFGSLKWGSDGRFVLTLVNNGSNLVFKGNVQVGKDGPPIQSGDFVATPRSYDGNQDFVSVIVTSTVNFEQAYLFLLEAPAPYRLLTNRPIEDRAAEMQAGLDDSLAMLDRLGITQTADKFRKMAAWEDAHGDTQIAQFADAAEKGDPSIKNPTPPRQAGRGSPVPAPAPADIGTPAPFDDGNGPDPDLGNLGQPAPNVEVGPFDNSFGPPPNFTRGRLPSHRPPARRRSQQPYPPPQQYVPAPGPFGPPAAMGAGDGHGYWEN